MLNYGNTRFLNNSQDIRPFHSKGNGKNTSQPNQTQHSDVAEQDFERAGTFFFNRNSCSDARHPEVTLMRLTIICTTCSPYTEKPVITMELVVLEDVSPAAAKAEGLMKNDHKNNES